VTGTWCLLFLREPLILVKWEWHSLRFWQVIVCIRVLRLLFIYEVVRSCSWTHVHFASRLSDFWIILLIITRARVGVSYRLILIAHASSFWISSHTLVVMAVSSGIWILRLLLICEIVRSSTWTHVYSARRLSYFRIILAILARAWVGVSNRFILATHAGSFWVSAHAFVIVVVIASIWVLRLLFICEVVWSGAWAHVYSAWRLSYFRIILTVIARAWVWVSNRFILATHTGSFRVSAHAFVIVAVVTSIRVLRLLFICKVVRSSAWAHVNLAWRLSYFWVILAVLAWAWVGVSNRFIFITHTSFSRVSAHSFMVVAVVASIRVLGLLFIYKVVRSGTWTHVNSRWRLSNFRVILLIFSWTRITVFDWLVLVTHTSFSWVSTHALVVVIVITSIWILRLLLVNKDFRSWISSHVGSSCRWLNLSVILIIFSRARV